MSDRRRAAGEDVTVTSGGRHGRARRPGLEPNRDGPKELLAGRYRLGPVLGAGATAAVREAQDERLGRRVAVKILHPHLLPDEGSRGQLVAEGRAAARLSHRNIVQVHDIVVEDGLAAIVLELIQGEPLSARLVREGPLAVDKAVRVGRDVADALAHAHGIGILHLDVKPGNVLLGADGRARLVDFGIARALDGPGAAAPAGSIVGTLRYIAPEQLAGTPPGPAADIFALGAVLYEALTGVPAYAATTPAALIREHRLGPPRVQGVPRDLAALVEALLDPDHTRRPADATSVERALAGWQEGRGRRGPIPVHAPPTWNRGGRSPSQGRALAAGAALALLMAVAVRGGLPNQLEPAPRTGLEDIAPAPPSTELRPGQEPAAASPEATPGPPAPAPSEVATEARADEDSTADERASRVEGTPRERDAGDGRGTRAEARAAGSAASSSREEKEKEKEHAKGRPNDKGGGDANGKGRGKAKGRG